MKRIVSILSAIVLLISFVACSAPASEPEGSTTPATAPSTAPSATQESQETVVFADPVLEAMVRGTMGKPEGAITVTDAEAVTRLDVSFDWQQYISGATPIEDISGLEHFRNLESLDLSLHAITDITPLASLTKLTQLALNGNPIADIAPLAGLTRLKVLTLAGCAALDYSPLAKLNDLELLMLDNSTIADTAPLASLTSLKRLYLEGCELDYSPLADIYPNLEDKDFVIKPEPSTLAEFGFVMDGDGNHAVYDNEQVSVRINHIEWGDPGLEMWGQNCVRTVFGTDEYKVDIGYYPEHDTYVVLANKDGEWAVNYLYHPADGSFSFGVGTRESSERHVRAIFPDFAGDDLLLAPVAFYDDAVESTCGMTADELFALPFAPPSLTGFGFILSDETGTYTYFEREPHDADISIYKPEWGEGPDGQNVTFFDSDVGGYHLIIHYFADAGRYQISLHQNEKEGAFDIYPDRDEYGGEYPDSETVRSMLSAAFGTQEKEMYTEPLVHLEKFLQERFGMGIDELCVLPEQ